MTNAPCTSPLYEVEGGGDGVSLYFLILFHDDSRKILEEALVLAELLNI